jgi:glutathionylspermidine synthase
MSALHKITRVDPPFGIRETQDDEDLRAGDPVSHNEFAVIRRTVILDGYKWDPQVGDTNTLAPFPLILKSSAWKKLAGMAELLTAETLEAEAEIVREPSLLENLGLPAALRRVFAKGCPPTPALARVMRFDFHPTREGWRISEVNSDVPGGFSESSHFTAMMEEHFPQLRGTGSPADIWADALAAAAPSSGVIALLSAPGYMEDHQVIAFLAAKLRERGCRTHLTKPEQIFWRDGLAHLDAAWHQGPLDAVLRFYQAEWLSRLPANTGWKFFFSGGKTPVANPASAIISESKRFPLVFEKLTTKLPTWHALLPETRDPRNCSWACNDDWLLKTAFCNTGDTVSIRKLMSSSQWIRTRIDASFRPSGWIAQKRFESSPLATPIGPRHACLGIYTVNGKTAGTYARISEKPLIDFAATDVALLLEDDE